MGAIIQQPQMFLEHIAKLEKQNQMLKWISLFLFLMCLPAMVLIAWQFKRISAPTASSSRTKIISANEFDLRDENGKLQGTIAASTNGTDFFLNGPNGKLGLMFSPGSSKSGSASLSVMSANGEQEITLNTADAFSWVTIGAKDNGGNKIQMRAGDVDQSVTVSDKAGFQAILGRASLIKPQTGESKKTSVAALTLLGNDGHVIWMAPTP